MRARSSTSGKPRIVSRVVPTRACMLLPKILKNLEKLSSFLWPRFDFLRSSDVGAIPRTRVILDPGIAFGKTALQNVEVIARLDELMDFGCPILVGASRKRFLGSLVEGGIEGTLAGTIAASLAALAGGATLFRVHDVAEHVAALRVFHTIWSKRIGSPLRIPSQS